METISGYISCCLCSIDNMHLFHGSFNSSCSSFVLDLLYVHIHIYIYIDILVEM